MAIQATRLMLLATLGAGAAVQAYAASDCAPLPDEMRDTLTSYFKKLAKLPPATWVNLTGSALEGETCYRRLEFSIGGEPNKAVLFLSPDQRFLSPQLFDSHVDPAQAEAAEAANISARINSYLSTHKHQMLGEERASVTIAVFADFQCPFCKRAVEVLTKEIFPSSHGRVRIAYVHYPLASHNWARQAAEWMACMQRPQAFWEMQEFLFDHQPEINPSNLAAKLSGHLGSLREPDTDLAQFKSCAGSKDAARWVDDDVALGRALTVSGTPTLFINGQRVVGLKSAHEVERLIPGEVPAK